MDDHDQEILFTAIVVTLNEEARLSECLKSIRFCDQIIVVDLGSTDRSVEIARENNAELFFHPRVPIVELVLPVAVASARHEWILRFDPDEVFSAPLEENIREVIAKSGRAAMIRLPHQYYFLAAPLRTTVWGGINHIPRIFHRDRVEFHGRVHQAISPKEGFTIETADPTGRDPVHHYWIESIAQLFEKHRRYIAVEGSTRFGRGERFSWRKLCYESLFALYMCSVRKRGLLGGWRGAFLSLFYAWYVGMSLLSLRRTQQRLKVAEGST